MATDFENNYYTKEGVKGYNSQNYAYTLNQSDAPSISIQNAKSLDDIPHKLIKQKNSNEFYIKYNPKKWLICLFPIVSGGFIAMLIILLLYASDDISSKIGIGFGLCICGFIFCLTIYGFISEPDTITFYLEQDSIRIKIILNCCCLRKNTILRQGDIQKFDLELYPKTILYINNEGEKKNLISLDFYGDEAAYLVNALNRHLGIET